MPPTQSVGRPDLYYIDSDGERTSGFTTQDSSADCASKSVLTLISLDDFYKFQPLPAVGAKDALRDRYSELRAKSYSSLDINSDECKDMRSQYSKHLKSFCHGCEALNEKILWRNIREPMSRYESRFRACKSNNGTCFLQYHTMQAPYLASLTVVVAVVHHVFLPSSSKSQQKDAREKIFAFVLGFDQELREGGQNEVRLDKLWDILETYQEDKDGGTPGAGITLRLFMAAIFKLYGFAAAKNSICTSFAQLKLVDRDLLMLEGELHESQKANEQQHRDWITRCTQHNRYLMDMNKTLSGVRSQVHYIGLCAQSLSSVESGMAAYIRDGHHSHAWPGLKKHSVALSSPNQHENSQAPANHEEEDPSLSAIRKFLSKLDSVKYALRDHDKLDMVARAMSQYEVELKSLKAHATLASNLVANTFAHIQSDQAQRDGSNVYKITALTYAFLPATFFLIFITSPIVQWDPDSTQDSTAVKHVQSKTPTLLLWPMVAWSCFVIGITALTGIWLKFGGRGRLSYAWKRLSSKQRGNPGADGSSPAKHSSKNASDGSLPSNDKRSGDTSNSRSSSPPSHHSTAQNGASQLTSANSRSPNDSVTPSRVSSGQSVGSSIRAGFAFIIPSSREKTKTIKNEEQRDGN